MFIGHFGVAMGIKAAFPETPLPALILATQAVDVVYAGLSLVGVERAEYDENGPATFKMRMTYVPYSHGLVPTIILSFICAYLSLLFYPSLGLTELFLIGVACFSHWILDLIVHEKDLPLWRNTHHVGLGLWHHRAPAISLEMAIILGGAAAMLVAEVSEMWKIMVFGGLMLISQSIAFAIPLPRPLAFLAVNMLATYAVFTALAVWVDL